MVFPTFFNLSLNLAIRSPWPEPQSALSLVFADCIELLHLWLQRIYQSDFSIDHLVMSMCRVLPYVVGKGCLLWPVCSLGLWPAPFYTPRLNLPVTPDISWLSTFAFQSPIMRRTSLLGPWAQWLKLMPSLPRAQVQTLVGELRSCKPWVPVSHKKKKAWLLSSYK